MPAMTTVSAAVEPWRARLKLARKERRLTQEELGRKIGRSQSLVASWEIAGGSEPSFEDLAKAAKALHVDPAWIAFGGATPAPAAPYQPRPLAG